MITVVILSAIILGSSHGLKPPYAFTKSAGIKHPNNVCKTFEGYYTNHGCYYNPDQHLELPAIVERYGFPIEKYEVVTIDGYILNIFRIPSQNPESTPVFLQHGIYSSSISFLTIGHDSLGFILAEKGYDVWLGNFRGTRYSRKHTHLSNKSLKYWDFSFHELGVYDTASQLDVIHAVTGKPVIYIGYSLGSISGHVYSSVYPEEAKKTIKTMISLAPTALLETSGSSLGLLGPLIGSLETMANTFSHGELFPRGGRLSKILSDSCLPYPYQMKMCHKLIQTAFGVDDEQINPETLPITLTQNADSISVKTVVHQAQIVKSRKFRQYDYGPKKNEELYGTHEPPKYNLSRILVPNYLIYGKGDYIATKHSVMELYHELSDEAKKYGVYAVPYPKFSHTDFIMAKDVKKLLYDHIVEFMAQL